MAARECARLRGSPLNRLQSSRDGTDTILCNTMNGAGNNHLGVNLAFTKFLFFSTAADDGARTRLRNAAAVIQRGFFNDFDSEARDSAPQDTIQFFVNEQARDVAGLAAARYAIQISSKYRPRLDEAEAELRRRLNGHSAIQALNGATRNPQYTSPEMHAYAYRNAMARQPGRMHGNAIILPLSKTADWWLKHPLERHAYFYPSTNGSGPIKGHARSAHDGIATIYRRLYYNPDGVTRADEFDFITYFECSDEHLATFDRVRQALRDRTQNPEWEYVIEGPEWRGRRVLKW